VETEERETRAGVLAVGAVVLSPGGNVLLVKRGRPPKSGSWSLPGGRVEANEPLEAAVVREVREETGLSVIVRRDLGVVSLQSEGYFYELHEYLCEPPALLTLTPGDDAVDVCWVSPAELRLFDVGAKVEEVVKRAIHG
jgi:8-oxo-dGTP diphosphatase